MRTFLQSLFLSLALLAPTAHAVGLAMDGSLIGMVDRPPLPCFGDSCYIPCQQAFDAAGNVSAVSNACLQHCMLNNGGGGSAGGFPGTFFEACTSCASTDIKAAIKLGLYANCKVAATIGGGIIEEVVEATGCGEEPETCATSAGNAGSLQTMQTVADAMNVSLGAGTVTLLKTPQAKAAALAKRKAQIKMIQKKKK